MFNKKRDDGKWYLGLLIVGLAALALVGFNVAGTGIQSEEDVATDSDSSATGDGEWAEGGGSAGYEAGTYEGSAEGHSGDPVVATVTVNEEEIESVEFEHNDTPDFADSAAEEVSTAIVEENSPDVEIVSGATISSTAMIQAAGEALNEASAGGEGETDADSEASPAEEGEEAPAEEETDADSEASPAEGEETEEESTEEETETDADSEASPQQ